MLAGSEITRHFETKQTEIEALDLGEAITHLAQLWLAWNNLALVTRQDYKMLKPA